MAGKVGRPLNTPYDRTWLETKRFESGQSQHDMAKLLGINVALYNRIEHGLSMPTIKQGMMLAKALDFNPYEWLKEKPLI